MTCSGAEGVRFELTRPFGLPVFKTGAINRSATPPEIDRAPHAPVARKEQLDSRRSHFFPIGTVPAEKFFQSLDIGLVKINKIFSLVTGDFACIRRRTGFYMFKFCSGSRPRNPQTSSRVTCGSRRKFSNLMTLTCS